MAKNQVLPFSAASVVEDVLLRHGTQLSDIDMASRKAEEASSRRNDAAGWLRKMAGVVLGKDLPAEPSEQEFRLGLRSGIILCNVLNKVEPGAVPKVVKGPYNSVIVPDGAPVSAYPCFENIRNFLTALQEMGLPNFEASELEQGGKSARIVNCVLALKSYNEWKLGGKVGTWKYSGNPKRPVCENSEPFMNTLMKTWSMSDKFMDSLRGDPSSNNDPRQDLNEAVLPCSVSSLVRQLLLDKKQEEIPIVVESMLSRVMEEFECRLENQNVPLNTSKKVNEMSGTNNRVSKTSSEDEEMEEKETIQLKEEECSDQNDGDDASRSQLKEEECCDLKCDAGEASRTELKEEECSELKCDAVEASRNHVGKEECCDQNNEEEEAARIWLLKQQNLVEKQRRDIQNLKSTIDHTKAGMQLLQKTQQEEISSLGKHLHGLASAASGYQKVLEENRKLYNQVQDLKGNIRVYCRVRPFLPGQPNHTNCVDHIEEASITLVTPSKYGKEGKKSFTFNKVFGPSATQGEVFADTQPLIRSVLDGYNVCIFAYGQTGTGKTYTMTGPNDLDEESMGVNYRALRDLFLISEQRKDTISYNIGVQMLEIYNEQVRDLLATDCGNKRLEIRNNSPNRINVPDANLVPVSSTADVIYLMNLGHKNRAVSSTAMNDRSSRSHSCLTVHVQGKNLTSGNVLHGCMHLVDLAGSERVDKSEVTGDRLKEAQHINKSLAALGDVISSLALKNSHVPYRNSKLTQLLQDALGGQAKTLMFVHISPDPEALVETLSTLKFAERVSTVELGAARINKDGSDVKELKEELSSLKSALASKDGETDHVPNSLSSSPERSRTKSQRSSPLHPSLKSNGDISGGHSQPMENARGRKSPASKLKRRSLDPQDMIHSAPCSSIVSPAMSVNGDDKDSVLSADWVDNIMVNKNDSTSGDHNLIGQWEEDDTKLHVLYLPDPPKIYPEQISDKVEMHKKDNQGCEDVQRSRSEVAKTDDSDDFEVATSDSSEPDLLWQQLNVPKPTNIPNGFGMNGKKSYLKAAKSAVTRSSTPSAIPSPSRKVLPNTSVSQQPASQRRPGRQAASQGDRRQRAGNPK